MAASIAPATRRPRLADAPGSGGGAVTGLGGRATRFELRHGGLDEVQDLRVHGVVMRLRELVQPGVEVGRKSNGHGLGLVLLHNPMLPRRHRRGGPVVVKW